MTPIRILIIAILIYILYRLIVGPRKQPKGSSTIKDGHDQGEKRQVEDVLVEDPVCHTYIPQKQSLVLQHKGKAVHFCSEKCRESFLNAAENDNSKIL